MATSPKEGWAAPSSACTTRSASTPSPRSRRSTAGSPAMRLGNEAAQLIGLGPGLTPSGDDYLGGVLSLRWLGRGSQADSLWRWLEPRLAGHTSEISAAHPRRRVRAGARSAARGAGKPVGVGGSDLHPSRPARCRRPHLGLGCARRNRRGRGPRNKRRAPPPARRRARSRSDHHTPAARSRSTWCERTCGSPVPTTEATTALAERFSFTARRPDRGGAVAENDVDEENRDVRIGERARNVLIAQPGSIMGWGRPRA